MRLKIFLKTIFLASLICLFSSNTVFAVDCAPGVTPLPCPPGQQNCTPCDPPTLPGLEVLAVEVLGFVWVMGGIFFLGVFIYNSFMILYNQQEEGKKRMWQWLVGLVIYFFSQPVVAQLMQTLVAPGNSCYDDLREPGFTFFFPQVCSNVKPTGPSGCPDPSYPCWPYVTH